MNPEIRTLEALSRWAHAGLPLRRQEVEYACDLFDADFGIVWDIILSPAYAR